jgi:hypothetical protein
MSKDAVNYLYYMHSSEFVILLLNTRIIKDTRWELVEGCSADGP